MMMTMLMMMMIATMRAARGTVTSKTKQETIIIIVIVIVFIIIETIILIGTNNFRANFFINCQHAKQVGDEIRMNEISLRLFVCLFGSSNLFRSIYSIFYNTFFFLHRSDISLHLSDIFSSLPFRIFY